MMKKYLLTAIAIFICSITLAQVVNIPDPELLNRLVNEMTFDSDNDGIPDSFVDTNIDGQIQVSETVGIDNLYLGDQSISSQRILDITGLEEFDDLEYLRIYLLKDVVDFTGLSSLKKLDCDCIVNNSITFNGMQNLEEIEFRAGTINNLSASNLPMLTSINTSETYGNNWIISDNPNFTTLRLNSYTGPQLTLQNMSNFELLSISHIPSGPSSQMTSLDLSGVPSLEILEIEGQPLLNSLNISQNVNLRIIDIRVALTGVLDLTPCTLLEEAYLRTAHSGIDLSNNALLTDLSISAPINTIDLSQNTVLESVGLNIDAQQLDLTNNTLLESLSVGNNQLQNLDLSSNPLISNLNLRYSGSASPTLSSIDLKNGANNLVDLNLENQLSLQKICIDNESERIFVGNAIRNANLINIVVNSYCTTALGGYDNQIIGHFRFDTSGTCTGTSPNVPFQSLEVQAPIGLLTYYADANGKYSINLPDGQFDLVPIIQSAAVNAVNPSPAQVNLPASSSPTQQDFCLSATTAVEDLEAIMLPIAEARPGFDADYTIVLNNKGNQPLSGTIDLAFDDAVLDYVSSSTTPASQSTGAISWSFTTLQPFSSDQIDVTFNLNSPQDTPPLNSNDILDFTVTGSATANEATPADNTMTLSQTVVNSFDPNDKTCLEGETIDPAMIGEYIHYRIRFENTGTASAINVVVRDEIDETMYDVSSLVPLESSHDYYTRITDNVVEFIFEDINLDFNDATNDGYVLFKIKTLDTLQVDDTVSNTAEIYFDFNFPIITDPANSTFTTLGIGDVDRQDESIKTYPTPFNRQISISAEHPIELIEVYDLNGRMVRSINVIGSQTDVNMDGSSLASGSYFLHITTSHGEKTIRSVKR